MRCGTQVTRAAGFNVGAPGSGVNPPTLAGAMKIRFNRNISNLKVTVNAIQIQQRIRYILRRGGVQVPPVLTLSPGGTCNTQFTHESSSGTIYPTGIGGGFAFNLGGVWFDEVEIITPSTPPYYHAPRGVSHELCQYKLTLY